MGLEPTVSSVTGWHVNRLHHGSAFSLPVIAYQFSINCLLITENGGRCRIRTYDPLLVRQVLSPAELIARVFDDALAIIPKIIVSVNRYLDFF
jgi:hypothetical protein